MNNIFEAIPKNMDTEVFESLVDSGNVTIERIISKGHSSPDSGWYDQDRNEWVLVLKGGAILQFTDGSTVSLKTGDYINIPAQQKHKVKWTDPDVETVWLAIHY